MPFPAERKRIDIGDFYADTSQDPGPARLGSRRSPLREGLDATIAYYREHKEHYL